MTQGEKLKAWRLAKEWNLMAAGAAFGVSSPSVVSRMESGDYRPGLDLALRIERLTGGKLSAGEWPKRAKPSKKRRAA